MSEINVVAAPVTSGPAPTGNATTTDPGAVNPFAAILQQQLSDPTSQALLAAKTDLAAAATDQLPQALKTLLPALLSASGLTAAASGGRDGQSSSTTAKDQPDTPGIPTIDMLLALPVTPAILPSSASTGTGTGAAPADPQNAANPALALPTSNTAYAANLAAAPDVMAATASTAQPVAKDSFETLLTTNADACIQATVAQAHAAPAANGNALPSRVDNAVGSPAWNNDVGDHMVWMANHGQSRAELVLTPPQLGRIEISLSMSGDQANAVFISASPAVREALENAMPRLREILADAGVTLAQTQVGADTSGQSTNGRESGDNSSPGRSATAFIGGTTAAALATSATNPWLRTGRGMVDVFA